MQTLDKLSTELIAGDCLVACRDGRSRGPTLEETPMTVRTRLAAVAAVALGVTLLASAPAQAADGRCQAAGIATLKSIDAFQAVREDGVSIATAVSLGVTVRDGADISGVPDPIPFQLLLADHRAGDASLFVYPWCE